MPTRGSIVLGHAASVSDTVLSRLFRATESVSGFSPDSRRRIILSDMRRNPRPTRPKPVGNPSQPAAAAGVGLLLASQLVVAELSAERLRKLASDAGYLSCFEAVRLGPFADMPDAAATLYFLPPDKLILVFYSERSISDSVVARVNQSCHWVEKHPGAVWASIRDKTQLGPTALSRAVLFVRLVAPGFVDRAKEQINAIDFPTAAIEFGLARSGSQQYLLHRVHEVATATDGGRQEPSSGQTEAGTRGDDPYAAGRLLSGLRKVVDGLGGSAGTIPATMFVRIYGLLVVLAARLVISDLPASASRKKSRPKNGSPATRIASTFGLLGKLLRVATTQKSAFDRGGKHIRITKALRLELQRYCAAAAEGTTGELSLNWQAPVPVTFKSFIDEMAFPETGLPLDRRDQEGELREHFQRPRGTAEAICGVTAINRCCDMLAAPVAGRRTEIHALTSDLVRVACGHRLLVELVGLPNRSIAVGMLSDAMAMVEILSPRNPSSERPEEVAARVAAAKQSGLLSISNMQSAGRLNVEERRKSDVLVACIAQERALARFFRRVI